MLAKKALPASLNSATDGDRTPWPTEPDDGAVERLTAAAPETVQIKRSQLSRFGLGPAASSLLKSP